jgi:putative CocE/NonD family hydrolase
MSIYDAIEASDRENQSSLVVGPWRHGGWAGGSGSALGEVEFGSQTATYYREQVEFPWFEEHLRGDGSAGLAEAVVFETGSNLWHQHTSWPPAEVETRILYLQAEGALSFDPPGAGEGFDEFVSDPADPVPFSASPGLQQGHTWMVEDQRFADGREDVLVYRTGPLARAVRIAGPIVANLSTETTGTDADWIVKLIDVSPDGFQMLLAGEVFRAKFRNSFAHPEPLIPGEVTAIEFELGDKYHAFLKGHEIMVQIQSSWFPVIDRNPQRFVDIYHAEEGDFQAATHRVHRSRDRASHLKLGLLPVDGER